MFCDQCGGDSIISDPATGNTVCESCGFVLDSSAISSEVTFAEGSGGSAHLLGQCVGATNSSIKFSNPNGSSRDSREVTLGRARHVITRLATALHLRVSVIDAAERLYLLALQHGFTRGRSSERVCASCLYAICRRERVPIMLIDLSEILKCNVYALGHTYLKLIACLHLELPLIDPSLYIHRFAHKLEFGKKEHIVAQTALQIIRRMKRDWLHIGRRPSGLCGAALVVSARLHGFERTLEEVTRVVKICSVTVQRRLIEFAKTPVGDLTIEEFNEVDLDTVESFNDEINSEEVLNKAANSREMAVAQEELNNQLTSVENRDAAEWEFGVAEDLSYLDSEIEQYLSTEIEINFRRELIDTLFGKFLERQDDKRKERQTNPNAVRKRRSSQRKTNSVSTPKVLSKIDINAVNELFSDEVVEDEEIEEEIDDNLLPEYEVEDEFDFLPMQYNMN
ncbi:hypothetical protein RCL1_006705 [Eukaryota sp. TZLM3-RCL]